MPLSVVNAEIVRDSTGSPPRRPTTSPSTIARRMLGTPGSTKTLPIRKPGALLTGLSISAEPSGTSAIFSRASLRSATP